MSIRGQGPKHNRARNSPLLDTALEYQQRGWSVIPTDNKKLATCRWKRFQTEPADEDTLRQLFSNPRALGIAVITGPISGGLAIRDFDINASYLRWGSAHPELAKLLPTVKTGRGYHVYFRGPEEFHKLADGEYRGDSAHYCLLPPSRHPTGCLYEWTIPLPSGPLPVIDPLDAGLCTPCNTDSAVDSEHSDDSAITEVEGLKRQAAATNDCADCVADAIKRTLPVRLGERNRRLFEFARELKALPHLEHAKPGQLRPYVEQWHKLALPLIGTKPLEDSLIDFYRAWDAVKFPAGDGPLAQLLTRAARSTPPAVALRYPDPRVRQLIGLCRELQRLAGTNAFFLDCRTCGRLLGVEYTTAWRWLRLLCVEGVLELVSQGSQRAMKANEYRYLP